MKVLQYIITLLASIPEVIWAAIIASALTFLGVTSSNRANRKSLLQQLNHAAQEKDKEREMQLLRDVYIEAAEAMAEAIQDIQFLPRRIIYSDNLEICKKLLPALAKIHMVGTFDTIKNTTQFMEKFNQSTLPIVPEITKFAVFKQEITSLNNLSEYHLNNLEETIQKFEQMDSSSKSNILDIHKKTFNDIKTKYDATIDLMTKKQKQQKELHVKLLSMCLKASTYLQKESLHVILSIRNELNFEIDSAEYLSKMNEVFKVHEDILSPDNIKKLIHDVNP